MSSDAVDSYLLVHVLNPDGSLGEKLAENDNALGGGPTAEVTFAVSAGQRLAVLANAGPQQTGG